MIKIISKKNSILFLILLSGTLIRFAGLSFESPTCDELWWWNASKLQLHQINEKVAVGYPPIYFYAIHFYQKIFDSNTLFNMRFFSAFFGALSLVPFYLLSRQFLEKNYALLSLLLYAFAPYYIFESQNSKHYMFSTFFHILGVYSLIILFKNLDKIKYWIFYIICNIIILYTSYYLGIMHLGLVTGILALFYILNFKKNFNLIIKIVCSFIIPIIFFIPWIIFAKKYDSGVILTGFIGQYNPPNISRFIAVIKTFLIGDYIFGIKIISIAGILSFGFFLIFSLRDVIKENFFLSIPNLYFSLPLILVFIYSQKSPIFDQRYFTPFVFTIYISTIYGLTKIRTKLKFIFYSIILIITIYNQYNRLFKYELRYDWKSAAEYLKNNVEKTDLIITAGGDWIATLNYWHNFDTAQYYLLPSKKNVSIDYNLIKKFKNNIWIVFTEYDIKTRHIYNMLPSTFPDYDFINEKKIINCGITGIIILKYKYKCK